MSRTAGQLIKRGDKKFLLRVYLGTDPDTGDRRYLNKTVYVGKKEAQRILTSMLSQRDLGTLIEPEKISLNTFLDRWLETSAKPSVRGSTFDDYTRMLRLYIRPGLGEKELGKLQPFEFRRYMASSETVVYPLVLSGMLMAYSRTR